MKLAPQESYQESGILWLGKIPAHWEVRRIKDLSELQSGASITSQQLSDEGYAVYGGNGVRGYFPQYNHNGEYILIGRQGALCGNINYATGKFWASEHAVVVYKNREVNTFWYGELLRTMNLNQYSLAAAQPGLSVDKIKRIELPFAPPAEQLAIANYLQVHTAAIDRKIELLTQKIKLYHTLRKTLINETVCRGLHPESPRKDSGIEWIGEIPAHWEVKRLKDVADFRFSNVDKKEKEGEAEVRLCNYVDVYKNDFIVNSLPFMISTASAADIRRFSLQKGDVIITKDSETFEDIAVPALVKEEMSNVVCGYHLALIRAKSDEVQPDYLFYLFKSSRLNYGFAIEATGITRVGLGINNLADAPTLLPPIQEQTEIAAHLDQKMQQIASITGNLTTQITTLQELRKTLINDVVTGKLRVTA